MRDVLCACVWWREDERDKAGGDKAARGGGVGLTRSDLKIYVDFVAHALTCVTEMCIFVAHLTACATENGWAPTPIIEGAIYLARGCTCATEFMSINTKVASPSYLTPLSSSSSSPPHLASSCSSSLPSHFAHTFLHFFVVKATLFDR